MDPWSLGSEGKGLTFSDEVDFPFDAFARSRKALMEWDIMKPSYSIQNDGLDKVEFMELGFTDITGKHFLEKPSVCELGSVSSKQVASPTRIITPNSSFGEVESESGWKLSGSIAECNSRGSSLIDLQLGRLGHFNGAGNTFSKERSSGGKRPRTSTCSYSQTPFCQVQGCNMNLSASKDYHKRHQVCVAHSKTARVLVNGIEQRFCQQCSRFHLLGEFDDGKRSCRKRLAGHNERRRKPHLDSFSGESHKFLQSIQGARFLRDSFSKRAPFVGIVYPDKCNECPHIKFDEGSPQFSKSFLNTGKRYLPGITPSALSGSPNSSCALSLLSTQSEDLLSFQADDVGAQISGNTSYSSLPNYIGIDHIMLPVITDTKGIIQGSGFSNFKPQQETTVDLLQLSSRLQRVEQRRSCVQESEDLFGFLTT